MSTIFHIHVNARSEGDGESMIMRFHYTEAAFLTSPTRRLMTEYMRRVLVRGRLLEEWLALTIGLELEVSKPIGFYGN